jgi:hypothetical protein
MKIVQKTMVENLLHSRKKFTWIGKHGATIDGDTAEIFDGAYPSACIRKGQQAQMESDIAHGFCKVTIVTNLETMKPLGGHKTRQIPAAVKKANKVEETIKPQDIKYEEAERFSKGGIEEIQNALTEQVGLPGADALPSKPPVVEIFKDGGQAIGAEMVEKPEHIEQPKTPAGTVKPEGSEDHLIAAAEAAAEKAEEKVEAPAEEKKAPAKKTTTRKTTTRKTAAKKPAAKKTTTRRSSSRSKKAEADK